MPITLDEYEKLKKTKTKYNNVKTESQGINFDSRLEARYYNYLQMEQLKGTIFYFLRQVPFSLPGKIKYLVDFQIFTKEGTVRYIDVKGVMTTVSWNKIKQVQDLYPVTIEIITKDDF